MKKILLAVLLALSFNANALKFEALPASKVNLTEILVSGYFKDGDFDRFEVFMKRYQTSRVVISLDSPGGSVREGVLFGSYFYDNNIAVGIENRYDTATECLSACSIAYMSAKRKFFTKNSALGAHRFYMENERTGGAKTRAMQEQNEKDTKAWVDALHKYGRLAKIHPEFIEIMLKTPSSTMYYFNRRQMERYGAIYIE